MILQLNVSLFVLFMYCVCQACAFVHCCYCGHLTGKGWPLGPLFVVILLLSHSVSWDRLGTWLYRFLIIAVFLTLLTLKIQVTVICTTRGELRLISIRNPSIYTMDHGNDIGLNRLKCIKIFCYQSSTCSTSPIWLCSQSSYSHILKICLQLEIRFPRSFVDRVSSLLWPWSQRSISSIFKAVLRLKPRISLSFWWRGIHIQYNDWLWR